MEKAKLNVVKFDKTDVIATSGLLTLSGFYNKISNDQTMTYNGKTVNCYSTADEWKDMLNEARGTTTGKYIFTDGAESVTLTIRIVAPNDGVENTTLLNNSFVYNSLSGKFEIKQ